MGLHVVSGKRFDTSRNTSAVRRPPPDALPNLLRALERLRREQPELVAWIEAGHPRLTHQEHLARFGESYADSRRRPRG